MTVILSDTELAPLDELAGAIEAATGARPSRSDLIRSFVHGVMGDGRFTAKLADCATEKQRAQFIGARLRA